ncbi:alpha-ribazole phosphatase family protein [Pseudomonas sp. GD03842]|uniref:alpha-ribazole phosphatase family protein n=1 Tax=Pseudomonas sp. GD03842 TaxID=2975385 RepID=UPI002448476F|nr:alpha-ribazole phosphatase family protein [Pseudomonas sp. GD03842]MDH0748252.1 alpha-ribazole phosphatase family protein [Pseudomonas sp. GD03842]
MTLHLDLLRHGETEHGGGLRGSLDDALTPLGWQQMQDAVSVGRDWDRIVSSPLQRCARFAEDLAAKLGVPLHLEADVKELHFGDWEGLSTAQLMATDAEGLGLFWENPYTFTPPNGEPVKAFSERVTEAIQRLYAAHQGERVLLICHGGVMRLLLALARGVPREQLLQVVVGHGERFSLQVDAQGTLTEV